MNSSSEIKRYYGCLFLFKLHYFNLSIIFPQIGNVHNINEQSSLYHSNNLSFQDRGLIFEHCD